MCPKCICLRVNNYLPSLAKQQDAWTYLQVVSPCYGFFFLGGGKYTPNTHRPHRLSIFGRGDTKTTSILRPWIQPSLSKGWDTVMKLKCHRAWQKCRRVTSSLWVRGQYTDIEPTSYCYSINPPRAVSCTSLSPDGTFNKFWDSLTGQTALSPSHLTEEDRLNAIAIMIRANDIATAVPFNPDMTNFQHQEQSSMWAFYHPSLFHMT